MCPGDLFVDIYSPSGPFWDSHVTVYDLGNGGGKLVLMKWAGQTMAWAEREDDYFDLRPVFRSLGKPILIISSSERKDAYEEVQPLVEELDSFHLVSVNNTGHNMYMERPDAVAAAIERFTYNLPLPGSL